MVVPDIGYPNISIPIELKRMNVQEPYILVTNLIEIGFSQQKITFLSKKEFYTNHINLTFFKTVK